MNMELFKLYQISEDVITPLQASVVFLSGKHKHDAMRAAEELSALNARVDELENAVGLTLAWCGEDLPDDVKKALRNVLKGVE